MIAEASTRGRRVSWMVGLAVATWLGSQTGESAPGGPEAPGSRARVSFALRADERMRVSLELRLHGAVAVVARAYKRVPRLARALLGQAGEARTENRPGCWPDPG
jgi:hypothetical protein